MKKIILTIICIITAVLIFSACGKKDTDTLLLDSALDKAISADAQGKVKSGSITVTEKVSGTETKKEISYKFSSGENHVYISEKQGATANEYWYSATDANTVLGIQMYYGQPTVLPEAVFENTKGYVFADNFFTENSFGQAYGVEEMVNNVCSKIASGSQVKPSNGTYKLTWEGNLNSKTCNVDFSLELDDSYTIIACNLMVTDTGSGDTYTYKIKQETGEREAEETNSINTLAIADYSLLLLAPDGSSSEIKDGDTITVSPLDNLDDALLFQFSNVTPDSAVISIDEPNITVLLGGKDTDLLNVTYDSWEEVGEIYTTDPQAINKEGESYKVTIETLRKKLTFNVAVQMPELTVFKPAVSYFNGFGNTVLSCNEYTIYNKLSISFGANVNSFADSGYSYVIKDSSGKKIAEGSETNGIFTEFKQEKNGKYIIELVSLSSNNHKATLVVNVVDTPSVSQIKSGKYCATAVVADGNILNNVKVIVDYTQGTPTLVVGDKIFTNLVSKDDGKFNILSDANDVFRIYSPKEDYCHLFISYRATWEDSDEVFVELLPATPSNLLAGDVEWIDYTDSWDNAGTTVYGFKVSFSADGTGKHESNYQDDCEWFYSQFEWSMDANGNISVIFTETEFSDIKNISGKFIKDYSTLEITATYNNDSVKTMILRMLP